MLTPVVTARAVVDELNHTAGDAVGGNSPLGGGRLVRFLPTPSASADSQNAEHDGKNEERRAESLTTKKRYEGSDEEDRAANEKTSKGLLPLALIRFHIAPQRAGVKSRRCL